MPQYERLTEPFEIADGVVIPVGEYRMHRWGFQVETADKRPVVVEAELSWGEFYTGTRRDLRTRGHLQAEPRTSARPLEFERNDVSLARRGVHDAGVHGPRRLQLLAERLVGQPGAVRQRVEAARRAEPLPVDPPAGQRPVPGPQPRAGTGASADNRYVPSFDKGSVKLQYTFRL